MGPLKGKKCKTKHCMEDQWWFSWLNGGTGRIEPGKSSDHRPTINIRIEGLLQHLHNYRWEQSCSWLRPWRGSSQDDKRYVLSRTMMSIPHWWSLFGGGLVMSWRERYNWGRPSEWVAWRVITLTDHLWSLRRGGPTTGPTIGPTTGPTIGPTIGGAPGSALMQEPF